MDGCNLISVLSHWDISPQSMIPINPAAWQIDDSYILKLGKNLVQLEKSVLFSNLLREEGIPAPEYITASNGNIIVSDDGWYCLMRRLPGIHLDVYDSLELSFQLGMILARLHRALKNIEVRVECQHRDLSAEWHSYIIPEIKKMNIDVSKAILNAVEDWLENVYPILPCQLIHRDPHMKNLLFENGKLTGFIDFDLSENNVRIFDLCYLASSFLMDNIDDPEKSDRWKLIFKEMIQGYEEISSLSTFEHQSLKMLLLYIELLFTAFWSKRENSKLSQSAIQMAVWVMDHC